MAASQGVQLTYEQMKDFAQELSHSTIIPETYRDNPANCLVAIFWGAEIGYGPMEAINSIAITDKGEPVMRVEAMLALVKGSGCFEYMHETSTDTEATCTVKRKGENEVTVTFTQLDAAQAGLWGQPGAWQDYPRRMLLMRARGFALRDVFPDILKGIKPAEEVQDYRKQPRVTSVQQVAVVQPATAQITRSAVIQEVAPATRQLDQATPVAQAIPERTVIQPAITQTAPVETSASNDAGFYPEEKFEAKFQTYKTYLEDGTHTLSSLCNLIKSKKWRFTDRQLARLASVAKIPSAA